MGGDAHADRGLHTRRAKGARKQRDAYAAGGGDGAAAEGIAEKRDGMT